jgi:hypothetical protein
MVCVLQVRGEGPIYSLRWSRGYSNTTSTIHVMFLGHHLDETTIEPTWNGSLGSSKVHGGMLEVGGGDWASEGHRAAW